MPNPNLRSKKLKILDQDLENSGTSPQELFRIPDGPDGRTGRTDRCVRGERDGWLGRACRWNERDGDGGGHKVSMERAPHVVIAANSTPSVTAADKHAAVLVEVPQGEEAPVALVAASSCCQAFLLA